MNPPLHRSRKAVSTIVANLLIMAMVAAVGTTLFAWTVTGYGAYQSQVSFYLSDRSSSAKERFIIEHVWFVDGDDDGLYDQVELYIRNIGTIHLIIEEVYVDGVKEDVTTPELPLELGMNQVGKLEVTLTEKVSPSALKEIEILSSRGNTYTVYWEAR
ncbi:hypothetical protein [Candidatus Hecatella orcuttiae]|uniref:hypothetical protein n=1 Tax=Candidatus Hecatella orcuttiae TaxID=1935119 RepID=UPI002867DC4C|nr:hypothetical protein [Candidatus Hecatella orcuttiae]